MKRLIGTDIDLEVNYSPRKIHVDNAYCRTIPCGALEVVLLDSDMIGGEVVISIYAKGTWACAINDFVEVEDER